MDYRTCRNGNSIPRRTIRKKEKKEAQRRTTNFRPRLKKIIRGNAPYFASPNQTIKMNQVTIGGDRLGGGKKMKAELHGYERSTHDISYLWRSSMAAGTLVPFLTEVLNPGDTLDLELDMDGKTHPTVGPLFGSYDMHCDVYYIPNRLYMPKLQMNQSNVGLKMNTLKIPQLVLEANLVNATKGAPDNQQMNPSAIFRYFNIAGLGKNDNNVSPVDRYVKREFNALYWIGYWDVYRQYYANKQENDGYVLHTEVATINKNVTGGAYTAQGVSSTNLPPVGQQTASINYINMTAFVLTFTGTAPLPLSKQIVLYGARGEVYTLPEVFNTIGGTATTIVCSNRKLPGIRGGYITGWDYADNQAPIDTAPTVTGFPLANIDQVKEHMYTQIQSTTPYLFTKSTIAPFGLALQSVISSDQRSVQTSKMYSQEGLGLRTYKSDLFNNWLNSEWIAGGPSAIAELTSVDTSQGYFTIDSLIVARKVFNVMNRIAISDGSYEAWVNSVYSHDTKFHIQNPMYMGGLIRKLMFEEVISNASALDTGVQQPLGTLAGKGTMVGQPRGGHVTIKANETGFALGIVSIVPNVDYSQGNKWDMSLKTMDDYHKPALDQIGFQDLPTDQMAYWETTNSPNGNLQGYQSAGKQPAWIQYTTATNKTYGNFADPNNEMFMTLNRRYEFSTANGGSIKDLTTYIDPMKFNYIFAQTSRDAQNFWVQISVKATIRRKMSAAQIPNL